MYSKKTSETNQKKPKGLKLEWFPVAYLLRRLRKSLADEIEEVKYRILGKISSAIN